MPPILRKAPTLIFKGPPLYQHSRGQDRRGEGVEERRGKGEREGGGRGEGGRKRRREEQSKRKRV